MPDKQTYEELELRVRELEKAESVRNKTEEASHFKSALFEAQLASTIDGILVVDAQGKKILQNQRTVELFKIPKHIADNDDDEPQFQHVIQMIKNPDQFIEQVAHLYKHPEEISQDEIELKNGTILDRYSSPVVGEDGQYYGRIWTFHDITDRNRAENKLAKQNFFLEKAQELGQIGTWELDLIHNSLYWTDENCRIFGVPEGSVVDYETFIEKVHPDDRDYVDREWKAGVEGKPYDIEHRLLIDGNVKWVREKADIEFDEKMVAIRAIGVTQDITVRRQAVKSLLQSEKKLRLILDATPFPVAVVDLQDDQILYWSRSALELFGHTAPTASEWYQIAYPDPDYRQNVIERWKPFLEIAQASGLPVNTGEYQITCKDGSVKTCELYATFLPDSIIVTFNDLTERKQAEDALGASQQMIEEILNAVTVRVFWKDKNLVYLGCNEVFARDSGFDSSKDIIGKDDYQMGWRDQAELYRDDDKQVIESGCPKILIEEPQTTPAGDTITLLTNKIPLRNRKGEIVGILGTYMDITERKKAEESLRESEQRFRNLFDNAPLPYQSLDENGCFVEVNSKWLNVLGYLRDEVIGKPFADFLNPEWADHFKENFPRFKSIGEVLGVEFEMKKRDGSFIWVSFDGKIGRDNEGAFIQTHCVFSDITDKRQLEKKLQEQETALRHSQKMESIGTLAGGIAHDFNNMLSVIIGNAEMLMEDTDPAQSLYANLKEIKNTGLRSAELTQQLLAFARKQTVAPKVLDLSKTLEGISQMLQRLIGEDIDLAWKPCENLWSVKIDPSQIDQILANLCINARDAIVDVGKITIETGNVEFDETYCNDHAGFLPGEYVLLAVSDNGCGMNTETMGSIFEPFFTTKEAGKGTGLGLATVYGVVKQNNGFINVYSELGQGTTFRIYLPRHLKKADHSSDKGVNPPPSRGHETILLVEDEPAILKMTTMMLERLGYTVMAARTPGEAIHLAREHTGEIDLLVTDVVMPEMNGRNLAKNILSFYPNFKRLFMSGYTANVIAHHGILDEGVNFIHKPFSRENLGAKVREALDAGKV